MRRWFWLFFGMAANLNAQSLYVKAYGNPDDRPVVFLNGGPGYSSIHFEVTTAAALAQRGFYVIVYDRRGEGRSEGIPARFDYAEAFADIDAILEKHQLPKATLLGHSFGGILATLYAEKHPEKVEALVLIGAPVALQDSFAQIIATCRERYTSKTDEAGLGYLRQLETMNTASLEYASYCFLHAMQNGLYEPKSPTPDARRLYALLAAAPEAKEAMRMTQAAPRGYWINERYTTLNLTRNLEKVVASGMPVYGLYGKEDGLYGVAQIDRLRVIIGVDRLVYLENCSHNVFIDGQPEFLATLDNWIR